MNLPYLTVRFWSLILDLELKTKQNQCYKINQFNIRNLLCIVSGKFQQTIFVLWSDQKTIFDLLFSGLKPKSPDDLDITVLYAICREELKLKPPAKGWGSKPGANDTSTAADIERIHFYRNKISHNSSLKMDTNDFNDSVLDLLGV